MIQYRNVRSHRIVERPDADEWLEASSGWERVDDVDEPEQPTEELEQPLDEDAPDASNDNKNERNV